MQSNFKSAFVLIFIVFIGRSTANVFPEEEEIRIKSYIDTLMFCQNVTGLNVAASKEGQFFADGFGFAHRETNIPVTTSTKMNIGSVTKSLTSILAAVLISEAKNSNDTSIDWKTKVQSILGNNFKLNEASMTKLVSFEDFLSHRTGLESADLMFQAGVPKEVTRDYIIQNMYYLGSVQEFRDVWSYSNIGFVMVGYLLEEISKKSWENLIREKLFTPLGMSSSVFLNEQTFPDMATPYVLVKGQGIQQSDPRLYYILDQFGPAGSICSTPYDMGKFLQFMTSGDLSALGINQEVFDGLFKQKSIFPDFFQELYSLSPLIFPVNLDVYGYGMAWFLSKYRGYDMYFHTGSFYGFTSVVGLIPSKNIGVYLNANGLGEAGFRNTMLPTMYYIFDTLLGIEPWLNETTACTFPSPWVQPKSTENNTRNTMATQKVNMTMNNTEKYYGNYNNPLYGNFEVSVDDGSLTISYGLLLRGTLSHYSENLFNLTVLEPLTEVVSPRLTVNFEDLKENVFQRVRVSQLSVFDRNVSTALHHSISVYLIILFCSIVIKMM